MGLEPTTFSLATRRSTTELCPQFILDVLGTGIEPVPG